MQPGVKCEAVRGGPQPQVAVQQGLQEPPHSGQEVNSSKVWLLSLCPDTERLPHIRLVALVEEYLLMTLTMLLEALASLVPIPVTN